MKKKIIGRTREYARLDKCMREETAQLVLVYGRRRVGKTFLINQYYGNSFSFKLTGAYNKPKVDQLQAFINELNRKSHKKIPTPTNWTDAFELLREYIEEQDPEKKCVVFFINRLIIIFVSVQFQIGQTMSIAYKSSPSADLKIKTVDGNLYYKLKKKRSRLKKMERYIEILMYLLIIYI